VIPKSLKSGVVGVAGEAGVPGVPGVPGLTGVAGSKTLLPLKSLLTDTFVSTRFESNLTNPDFSKMDLTRINQINNFSSVTQIPSIIPLTSAKTNLNGFTGFSLEMSSQLIPLFRKLEEASNYKQSGLLYLTNTLQSLCIILS